MKGVPKTTHTEVKDEIIRLQALGFAFEDSSKGRVRYRHPEHGVRIVHLTPSDWRWVKNFRAQVARQMGITIAQMEARLGNEGYGRKQSAEIRKARRVNREPLRPSLQVVEHSKGLGIETSEKAARGLISRFGGVKAANRALDLLSQGKSPLPKTSLSINDRIKKLDWEISELADERVEAERKRDQRRRTRPPDPRLVAEVERLSEALDELYEQRRQLAAACTEHSYSA